MLRCLALVALALAACSSSGPAPAEGPSVAAAQGLVIDAPERGAFIRATSERRVDVRGRIGRPGERLTLNGQVVEVGADGSFHLSVPAEVGTNVLAFELGGEGGLKAQRAFLYGDFAPLGAVPSAAAIHLGRAALDGGRDSVARLAETALADLEIIDELPASYSISVPVVGTVGIALPSRTAGTPRVALSPRAGGLEARATLPDPRLTFRVTFGCILSTCLVTGAAAADGVVVQQSIDVALAADKLAATGKDVRVSLPGFRYSIDGSLGSAAKTVIDLFVPDLGSRLEQLVAARISAALPAQLGFALSQIALPAQLDLRPAIDARVELHQAIDQLGVDADGVTLAASVRVGAAFPAGSGGVTAPGWLRQGVQLGRFRSEPAFAVSVAFDSINQLLFAIWGQGALDRLRIPAVPGTALGESRMQLMLPPVLRQEPDGSASLSIGDVVVDTTLSGAPIKAAVSLRARVGLVLDERSNTAHIELSGLRAWVELLAGESAFDAAALASLLEGFGPQIGELLASLKLPLPILPLSQLTPSLAGTTLRLTGAAQVVAGDPPSRLTLYGDLGR